MSFEFDCGYTQCLTSNCRMDCKSNIFNIGHIVAPLTAKNSGMVDRLDLSDGYERVQNVFGFKNNKISKINYRPGEIK